VRGDLNIVDVTENGDIQIVFDVSVGRRVASIGVEGGYARGLWRGEKWAKYVRLICRAMHIYTGTNLHTIEEISGKSYMPVKETRYCSFRKKLKRGA